MLTRYSPKLLILLLAVFITGGIIAAKAPVAPRQYDYVTVFFEYGRLFITTGPNRFEELEAKPAGKNSINNLTPLLGKISVLEAEGYELVETHIFAPGSLNNTRSFALLRKPRN